MIKNWSFVTESKNLDPLMTIVFNAKVELEAQAKSNTVAEIFICGLRKRKTQKNKFNRERGDFLSLTICIQKMKRFRRLLYAFPGPKGKNVRTLFVGIISME